MAIILSSSNNEKMINSLYPKKEAGLINIYDRSTKGVVLEYFTIVNKILNHHTGVSDNTIIEKKESTSLNSHISLRQIHSSFIREPYKEKSFLENVSFFLSSAKDAVKTVSIDTSIESLNAYKENLNELNKLSKEYDELKKELDGKQTAYIYDTKEINVDEAYENELYELFKKYPEYKQAKDEFDRLENEKTQKIEQMNNLVLELDTFRQYILNEFNPIVLELLDLLDDELNPKTEYMKILEKLYQTIDYSSESTSSKETTKSEKLLKWDELKNCIEILEKDNKALDTEIDKIVENKYFENYLNNEFEYFHAMKSKLNSIIQENKIELAKKPIIQKDTELENLKKELKSLESKLQELVEQKTEYLNDIEEFNREYNLHLGELVKDILILKKEILYKKTIKQQKQKAKYQEDIQTFQESKETIDELKSTIAELEDALESIDEDDENYEELTQAYHELKVEIKKLEDELELQEEELEKAKEFIEDETVEQEYEEVKSHYEEFESEYEHIKESIENSLTLNDEEKKELKSLYKQAARLCHPDIVPDELKEKAHELMQKLNDAYSKKDISKIKEILHSLQNGTSFEVSSETIEDKELIRAKIKEYLKNIEAIKSEIEEIKEDDTYQTIAELDDWDEYFEELRGGLEAEKERLEEEAREDLEEKEKIEDNVLIQWAIQNNIDEILEHKNQLENIKRLRLNDKNLTHIPKEITSLSNLAELKLWKNNLVELPEEISSMSSLEVLTLSNNNLIKLPKNITQLKLKKLQLRDNKSLILTNEQIQWIKKLKENGCDLEMDKDLLSRKDIETTQEKKISKKTGVTIVKKKNQKEKSATITKEDSPYAKHIHSIENIKFEKIRKYCENLSKANEADEMQKQLGKTGKMYKALIYSSLEVFIEYLNGETITLCDWGCSQGIASMLVLDYIKEKQLDIKVSDVILIDDDTKSLSRAMVQVEALAQDDIKFTPIKSDDNSISDTIKSIKNNKVINLFANDKIPTNFWTINHDIFHDSYLLCVSNENKEFVNEVYETINIFLHVQDVSIRDGNIGRFDKYERIFRTLIDIDSDEIPF